MHMTFVDQKKKNKNILYIIVTKSMLRVFGALLAVSPRRVSEYIHAKTPITRTELRFVFFLTKSHSQPLVDVNE